MMGGMGIFEFPAMIEPDGGMGNLIVALAGVVITMVIAFAATMIFIRMIRKRQKKRRQEIVERKADRWKLREHLRQYLRQTG